MESSFVSRRLQDFLPIVYATITRVMFFVHGFITVWLIVHCVGNQIYWTLLIGIVCLLGEMIYTLIARKGHEYKYFWPSCFFYMATMIPAIWILEMEMFKLRAGDLTQSTAASTVLPTPTASSNTTSNGQCWGNISKEVLAKKVCELGLIVGIIIGRWMLPRGEITRDQLSALLLGYVGTAADTLELFEVFEEEQLKGKLAITQAVVGVFCWSLLQFTLVTTATTGKDNQIKITSHKVSPDDIVERKISLHRYKNRTELKEKYIDKLRVKRQQTQGSLGARGKGFKGVRERKVNPITHARGEVKEISRREMLLHGDIFGILTGIFMQDGPFLIIRLVLLIEHAVYSEMHIFFTCKNAIALCLLVYRLCILTCKGEDEEETEEEVYAARLQNVQQAVYSDQITKAGAIQLSDMR